MNKLHKILLSSITLFYVILYFPYFQYDPLLKRDDLSLITPITKLSNFSEYLDAVKSNALPDVQPIRDFSFYLNIKIDEVWGLKTFHLLNMVLMMICIHLLFRIFQALKWSPREITAGILLFACHPILVSALGWVSTRKHILALMFILFSLNEIIKKQKLTIKALNFYFASILSHQIFILYPVWVVLFLKNRKFEVSKKLISVMGVMGILVLGMGYYKTFTLQMGDATHTYYSMAENIGRFVLSSGRSFIILVFPNVISHSYYQGSIYNLIGIFTLVLYFYLVYKSPFRKECFLWLSLAFFTLIPTYIAFVNDTYLFLPLICFIISLVTLLKPFPSRKLAVASGIAISLLTIKTVTASRMWSSDFSLWQYSYEQEKAPLAGIFLGKQLLNHNPELAMEFIEAGVKDYNLVADAYIMIFFLTTVQDSNLPIDKKITILEEKYFDHEIYNAIYGSVLIEGNTAQQSKGLLILKKTLKPESKYQPNAIGLNTIKRVRTICKSSLNKTYLCHELNIKY